MCLYQAHGFASIMGNCKWDSLCKRSFRTSFKVTEEPANIQLNNCPETARWKVSDGTDIVAVNSNGDRMAIWTETMGLHYSNSQENLFVMKIYRVQAQFGRIWKQKFEHDLDRQEKNP